jgi:hypothetical protein
MPGATLGGCLPGVARGEDDPGDVEIALRMVLAMEGVEFRAR